MRLEEIASDLDDFVKSSTLAAKSQVFKCCLLMSAIFLHSLCSGQLKGFGRGLRRLN